MICPRCGNEIADTVKFCPVCGNTVYAAKAVNDNEECADSSVEDTDSAVTKPEEVPAGSTEAEASKDQKDEAIGSDEVTDAAVKEPEAEPEGNAEAEASKDKEEAASTSAENDVSEAGKAVNEVSGAASEYTDAEDDLKDKMDKTEPRKQDNKETESKIHKSVIVDEPVKKKAEKNGFAMASLIMSLVAVPFGFILLIPGILAIIFGIIGILKASKVGSGRGMSVAGLIIGIVVALMWILIIAICVALLGFVISIMDF